MTDELVEKRRALFKKIRVLNTQIKYILSIKNPIDKAWNDRQIARINKDKEVLKAQVAELIPEENKSNIEAYIRAIEDSVDEDYK